MSEEELAEQEAAEAAKKEQNQEENLDDEEDDEEMRPPEDDIGSKDPLEEEAPVPKTKKVKEEEWDWELINDQKPIWMRNKDEIEEKEYKEFYKAITSDYNDPLAHEHFTAEGEISFRSLLFVPYSSP